MYDFGKFLPKLQLKPSSTSINSSSYISEPKEAAQSTDLHSSLHRSTRGAAHTNRYYYWPNATIPYVLWPELELELPLYRERIESAIWEIELNSCVRFVERSTEQDYVVLYDSERGCYSDIGRQGGAQVTAVGRGCGSRGSVLHELLHTVGMWHTIARIDRDKHVRVNWDNMDVSSSSCLALSLYLVGIRLNRKQELGQTAPESSRRRTA